MPELPAFLGQGRRRAPAAPIVADIATITGATDKILRAAIPTDTTSLANGKVRFGCSIQQAFAERFHVAAFHCEDDEPLTTRALREMHRAWGIVRHER